MLVAVTAAVALWRDRRGHSSRGFVIAVAVLGVGVVLAPAIFQMFTRAPKGAEMIDAFRPIMTRQRVTTVQGYFLVIGVAEGEVRNQVRPLLAQSGLPDAQFAAELPAVDRFARDWPRISTDFAPMIGAMSNNLATTRRSMRCRRSRSFPGSSSSPACSSPGLRSPRPARQCRARALGKKTSTPSHATTDSERANRAVEQEKT